MFQMSLYVDAIFYSKTIHFGSKKLGDSGDFLGDGGNLLGDGGDGVGLGGHINPRLPSLIIHHNLVNQHMLKPL